MFFFGCLIGQYIYIYMYKAKPLFAGIHLLIINSLTFINSIVYNAPHLEIMTRFVLHFLLNFNQILWKAERIVLKMKQYVSFHQSIYLFLNFFNKLPWSFWWPTFHKGKEKNINIKKYKKIKIKEGDILQPLKEKWNTISHPWNDPKHDGVKLQIKLIPVKPLDEWKPFKTLSTRFKSLQSHLSAITTNFHSGQIPTTLDFQVLSIVSSHISHQIYLSNFLNVRFIKPTRRLVSPLLYDNL